MTNKKYKVWTTLTEPVLIKGVSLDYGLFLLLSTALIYTFSFNNYYVASCYIVVAYITGILATRRDKNWFLVVLLNVRYFGIRTFRRWRYVA